MDLQTCSTDCMSMATVVVWFIGSTFSSEACLRKKTALKGTAFSVGQVPPDPSQKRLQVGQG